ncbi:MAG: aromatic ring-hydroxylating dioxygenase subunit alpha [Hyphomonadaceae bacterium]|nr:aromatic ring-hydroxylating dioxygenase subunit alpha [Hyphomonadaceae bacterium]
MDISETLRHRILNRRAGMSLDAEFYNTSEVHALDLDVIFGRHWIYAACDPELPEPGDCVTVEVGSNSILLLRGEDMEVRGFHNVCRHRGARLIDARSTTIGNIVCRYHGWTYDETGKLLFAEHMGAGFDKSCHGLKPVHVRSVSGLLFICLDEAPPADIEYLAQTLTPYIAPHDLANCKVAHVSELVEEGNWKLAMENNRECYHCDGNHPQLTVPLSEFGFGFSPDELDQRRSKDIRTYLETIESEHARWEALGLPSAEVEELSSRVTGFRTMRLPLMGAGESHTLDTRAASGKLLGAFNESRLGGLSVWTQPNSWHHFMSDHIVTFSALPLAPDKTLVRTVWLVHKDAVEGQDYKLDNLINVWMMTNQQDADLVRLAQLGTQEAAYEPGPYSGYTEPHVEKFCEWYIGRLASTLLEPRAHIAAE